jgi:hypothetical protein
VAGHGTEPEAPREKAAVMTTGGMQTRRGLESVDQLGERDAIHRDDLPVTLVPPNIEPEPD